MKGIQDFVQQVIETMSTVLQVEITVVDRHLERIAGTGKFKSEIGRKIPKSFILSKSIETGLQYIVENPGQCDLCENCRNFGHCIETAIIALPVKSKSQVFGGMCLVAFNKKQRHQLLMNKKHLLAFIMHFSELISTKISENQLTQNLMIISEQLRSVIDTIHEGIIVIDGEGKIRLANSYAKRNFDPQIEEKMLGRNISEFLPDITLSRLSCSNEHNYYERGFLKINKKPIQIIYSLATVHIPNVRGGAILVYHLPKDANKLIDQISEVTRIVAFNDIIGTSLILQNAKSKANIAAKSDSTVLLLGESGTGKELFARAIHSSSKRKHEKFVAINCAAIPDSLLESELFGYERGAFTDASKEGKPGKFELANRGTILLDEIGDLTIATQAKLLRILEDRFIDRIGGAKLIPIDVRVIASTSKNIEKMIEKGEFRSDLYYRISTIPILLPSIRDRKEDIFIHLDSFRQQFNSKLEKDIRGFSNEVLSILNEYDWPGNVREIKNVVEYAINMETGLFVTVKNLPERIINEKTIKKRINQHSLESIEYRLICENLAIFGKTTSGKIKVSKELGISLATLYRKMKVFGLTLKPTKTTLIHTSQNRERLLS